MHSRSTTIIGAGVAVAILGAVLVFAYARSLQGSAGAASGASVGAYVATTAITPGTKGSALSSSVKTTTVPASARPADAVTDLSQVSSLQALRNIEAGEVIAASQFGAAGTPNTSTSGLAIPVGHNAITVTSPFPQAVAGYVSPGDLVNVYMTNKDGQAARLLVSNVSVLATVPANAAAPKTGTPATASPVAGDVFFTLSLTPAESEKVIFAQTYESLYYGLVHPGDGPAASPGQTLKTLFS
ncbi:MAG TPA: RcpC/CpaB family pilus assembly protein [Actinomycetota bacterium]|nr:RcpC/CpaB family pilus assembly protein [Actinomycetota bacterium]